MKGAGNHLIERLPAADRHRLLAECLSVDLAASQILAEPGQPVMNVYFPIQGFASLLTMVTGHPALEIGVIGREGVVGGQLAMGVAIAPLLAVVRGPGAAWCISRSAFGRVLSSSVALRRDVKLHWHVLTIEMAVSAGCMRFHPIGSRLARCLLMTQDRSDEGSFRVTHEHLAQALGVRRVGVTHAAGALQRDGVIDYRRGTVTVLDRAGLEAVSCDCYGIARRTYEAHLGEPRQG